MANEHLRIASVHLKSFRAVPGELTINLSNSEGQKASSCLLLGDNGTGKSSIIDAIEFALQGRVHPFFAGSNKKNIARLPNLSSAGPEGCFVEVQLSNGSIHSRSVERVDAGADFSSTDSIAVAGFDGANFVLRRQDILNFLQLPADRRPQFFAAFLRSVAERSTEKTKEREQLEAVKALAEPIREKQATLAEDLAGLLKVSPDRIQPFNLISINSLFVEHGLIKKALRRRRALHPDEEALFSLREQMRKNLLSWQAAQERIKASEKKAQFSTITNLIGGLSSSVSAAFAKLSASSNEFIREIRISLGEHEVAVSLTATLLDGTQVAIEEYLSEANLDLLALVLFLTLLKEAARRGQAKVLILDDVLQSVDGVIRLQVAQYILEDFSDWQLILTFHDRLWRDQFLTMCAQKAHTVVVRDIVSWTFSGGPVVVQSGRDAAETTRSVISSGSPSLIVGQSGILLETMCDWLSKSLSTSITRKANDKYTLGDTWPGVLKVLRRYELATDAERVEAYAPLRNIVGAHYNEWAQSITLSEARYFADAVVRLWSRIWCSNCRTTVSRIPSGLSCRCGSVMVMPS